MTGLETKLNDIFNEKNRSIKPENIKKDVRIFDVVGTYTGKNSMLYNTKNDMLNDTTQDIGTIGTVYENRYRHPVLGDIINGDVYFPISVQLSEAVTSNISYNDGLSIVRISLSASSMQFRYTGTTTKTINYSSTDGINYIRSSDDDIITMNNYTITNGTSSWNSLFNEFMLEGGMYLDGVYKYEDRIDTEWFAILDNVNIDNTNHTMSTTNTWISSSELANIIVTLTNKLSSSLSGMIVKVNDNYYFQNINQANSNFTYKTSTNKLYYGSCNASIGVTPTYKLYSLDLVNNTFTFVDDLNYDVTTSADNIWAAKPYQDGKVVYIYNYKGITQYTNISTDKTAWTTEEKLASSYICGNMTHLTWHRVNSQFTLTKNDEVLPNKVVYGKYGTITGNSSVYNNIDYCDMLSNKTTKVQAIRSTSSQINKSIIYNNTPTSDEILSAPVICNIHNNTKNISSSNLTNIGFSTTKNYILIFNSTTKKVELYDKYFNFLLDVYTISTSTTIQNCYLCENPNNSNDLAYMIINTSTSESISGKINVTNQTLTSIVYNSTKLRDLIYDGNNYYSAFTGNATDIKYGILKNGNTLIQGDYGTVARDTNSITMDNNYIYVGCNYANTSGYQIFVWNKSTEAYVGKITDSYAQSHYMITPDLDTGDVYLCNAPAGYTSEIYDKIYKLNGTTVTEVYSFKYDVYGYHIFSIMDNYCLANNSSCIFTLNGKKYIFSGNTVADLSTGVKADVKCCSNMTRTSQRGCKQPFDLGFVCINNTTLYRYIYVPTLKLVNSVNVLLEQEDPTFKTSNLSLYYSVMTDIDAILS